jgi:acetyl-CoA carboxylase biotin carboxyl carrier protein
MDIRKIKKLIEMLQESDLKEIEVSQGDESVRILRGGQSENHFVTPGMQTQIVQPPHVLTEKVNDEKLEIGSAITSPIVGTFYRKPSPDKNPFIKVGDSIEAGDVLCIVEAMKMMNEIKSDISGKIISIDVEDGEPVEFGQRIITIN